MKRLFFICVSALFLLTGCFALPVEEALPPPVLTFTVPEFSPWRTAVIGRGDIVRYTALSAQSVVLEYQRVYFPVTGVPIYGVNVALGDEVNAGDVLARLYTPGLDEQLDEVRREFARLSLYLDQNAALHTYSLNRAEITGIPVDDSVYINRRELLQWDLDLVQAELNYLSRMDEANNVRAPISGVITHVMHLGEAPVSTLVIPAAIISAWQDYAIYRVVSSTAEYVNIGDVFDMSVLQGGNLYNLIVEAIDIMAFPGFIPPETSLQQAHFIVTGGDYMPVMPYAAGRLIFYFGRVFDVIMAPVRAVSYVNGESFVFVMEDGLRVKRYVETGLNDGRYIEIISGLEAGEVVVV